MLFNSRKESFSFKASDWLARVGQCASVLRNTLLKNGFGHVPLNPLNPLNRRGTKIGKQFLFTNFCAPVIVSTWVILLKGYNRGLSGTCPKPFFRSIFLRTEAHWPALASQSEALKLKLSFLLFDNIVYKTLHAHVNIMITNFLFLPMAVLLFIFPLLKPHTSKHPNQIYANKRNSFMV